MPADWPFAADSVMIAGAVLLAALAVYTDLRWRLIPNRITLPAIALGLTLSFLSNGWHGLLLSLAGMLVGAGILFLPFAVGKMGGGDVKLMGALGAWLGSLPILNVALYSALVGGVLAIVIGAKSKRLIVTIKNMWLLLKCIFVYRAPEAGSALLQGSIAMPYGVAIAGGVMCFIVFGRIV